MINILNAGCLRLRKSRLTWAIALFAAGLALFIIYMQYRNMVNYGSVVEVGQLLLNYSTIIGIVVATFTALFLGVEHSDGGIRNKVSIGHKRTHIYLANLLITTAATLLSYLLFMAVIAAVGIPVFGAITIPIPRLAQLLGCIFAAIIAYSAIFTFIAMTVSNKAVTAVISVILAFVLMSAALTCLNIVAAPTALETAAADSVRYPGETRQQVAQLMADINPAGQMFQLSNQDARNMDIFPLYSLGILIVFTGAGLVIFNKKQLK